MQTLLTLFWLFLKVNLLSTSGIASVGLLHQEAVGTLLTEQQFVQAVSFSSVLPGSDALQIAMYVGYKVGGMPGAMAALLGSILPPTLLMLLVVMVLHRVRRVTWVSRFVQGLSPAVAVLMMYIAAKLVLGGNGGSMNWQTVALAVPSLVALLLDAPPPIVLLISGILGIFLFR